MSLKGEDSLYRTPRRYALYTDVVQLCYPSSLHKLESSDWPLLHILRRLAGGIAGMNIAEIDAEAYNKAIDKISEVLEDVSDEPDENNDPSSLADLFNDPTIDISGNEMLDDTHSNWMYNQSHIPSNLPVDDLVSDNLLNSIDLDADLQDTKSSETQPLQQELQQEDDEEPSEEELDFTDDSFSDQELTSRKNTSNIDIQSPLGGQTFRLDELNTNEENIDSEEQTSLSIGDILVDPSSRKQLAISHHIETLSKSQDDQSANRRNCCSSLQSLIGLFQNFLLMIFVAPLAYSFNRQSVVSSEIRAKHFSFFSLQFVIRSFFFLCIISYGACGIVMGLPLESPLFFCISHIFTTISALMCLLCGTDIVSLNIISSLLSSTMFNAADAGERDLIKRKYNYSLYMSLTVAVSLSVLGVYSDWNLASSIQRGHGSDQQAFDDGDFDDADYIFGQLHDSSALAASYLWIVCSLLVHPIIASGVSLLASYAFALKARLRSASRNISQTIRIGWNSSDREYSDTLGSVDLPHISNDPKFLEQAMKTATRQSTHVLRRLVDATTVIDFFQTYFIPYTSVILLCSLGRFVSQATFALRVSESRYISDLWTEKSFFLGGVCQPLLVCILVLWPLAKLAVESRFIAQVVARYLHTYSVTNPIVSKLSSQKTNDFTARYLQLHRSELLPCLLGVTMTGSITFEFISSLVFSYLTALKYKYKQLL